MENARLLGKQECHEASEAELHLLRLLTPISKLYTAKQVSGAKVIPLVNSIASHSVEPVHIFRPAHTRGHVTWTCSGDKPLVWTALAHVAGTVRKPVHTKRIEA